MRSSLALLLLTTQRFLSPIHRTTAFTSNPYKTSITKTIMKVHNKSTLNTPKSEKVIGTHSGTFQADEALGVFLIRQLPSYYQSPVIRSRDPSILSTCDIVLDVGGEYNHSTLKYDHHQNNYNEKFSLDSCTNLSASGLIYRHYGKEVIRCIYPTLEDVEWVYTKMYKSFMEAIDAIDTGVEIAPETKYKDSTNLSSRVARLNPRWNEESSNSIMDERFEVASKLCGEDFLNVLETIVESELPAREIVQESLLKREEIHSSKQILCFEKGGLPWKQHLYELEKLNHVEDLVKFVLYPDSEGMWRVQAVTVEGKAFENRVNLPQDWCGLRDEELVNVSNIAGCKFVHRNGFIGGNERYEGALRMAVVALEQHYSTSSTIFVE